MTDNIENTFWKLHAMLMPRKAICVDAACDTNASLTETNGATSYSTAAAPWCARAISWLPAVVRR